MTTTLDPSHRVDWNGLELEVKSIVVDGAALSTTELGFVDGVTAGTALASKALVLNSSKGIATITSATITTLTSTAVNAATLAATTSATMTSASANALAVGLAGATNPAFNVDSSTASQAAGLNVIGAATGGTVAVACIDSGSATNLTVNAKGTGTIGIGSVSTGAVTITPATTITGALTASSTISAVGAATILNATAVPAGGTAGAGLKMSSTSNLGIFFGSSTPTLAAAQGSLYIRTDGSSTSTRLYINTTGSTTWTNVTTAA